MTEAASGTADGLSPSPGGTSAEPDITEERSAQPPAPEQLSLRQRVEAVLIVVDEPVTAGQLATVLESPTAEIAGVLAALRADYLSERRGFELRDVAGGWRLYSAAECAADVERFILDGTQARLTHAALETLAVVAYRQPVSRQAIAAIRGVGVDGVVRTLLARGLIAEAGAGPAGATLYVTTRTFLSRLGITALDELPSLAPYLPIDLDEFEDAF